MNRDQGSERGQILVIVAGGLIALLAIAALVLEGGVLVLNRRDAQNAADLASVAGTREVTLSYVESSRTQGQVSAAIQASLDGNGCSAADSCVWTAQFVGGSGLTDIGPVGLNGALPNGTLGVKVAVTRTVGALIGHAVGFDSWAVSTEATAKTGPPSAYAQGLVLPIALCGWTNPAGDDCLQASNAGSGNFMDFQPGQIYDLTDGRDAPGGFAWLSWTGSNSAGALADSVCSPNNAEFSLDSPYDSPDVYGDYIGTNPSTGETWFPVDPGKSNKNDVRACLDQWIASGSTMLVPVYDLVTGGGDGAAYHITGVAAFVLTSREQPAVDNIRGYFVEYYPYVDVPGGLGTQPPGPQDITYFLGLIR